MNYRLLSNTGIYVSELCLGTMTFGGKGVFEIIGALKQKEVDTIVHTALDGGINFFDTANTYAKHESEELLSKALGAKRKEVIVATKARFRMSDNVNGVGLSRLHLINQVEASLKALNTDYIDLYQIHASDPFTDMEETMRALNDLVTQGKLRYIGYCNMTAWQTMKANEIARRHGWNQFKTAQMYYSIAGRDIEREIVPMALDQNLSILPWSPLAGGFMTGKYTRETESVEGSRRTDFDFPPVDKSSAYDIIDVMREIAETHQSSIPQIALAWLLHKPAVTSVIIGARKLSQLEDNLKAINVKLSEEEMTRLNEVSALKMEYPSWFLDRPTDRAPGAKGWAD